MPAKNTKALRVYATDKQSEMIKQRAQELGFKSVSDYILSLIHQDIPNLPQREGRGKYKRSDK